jgi:hypothetical protein
MNLRDPQVGSNPEVFVQQCITNSADLYRAGVQQRVGQEWLPQSDPPGPYSYSLRYSDAVLGGQPILQAFTISKYPSHTEAEAADGTQGSIIATNANILATEETTDLYAELLDFFNDDLFIDPENYSPSSSKQTNNSMTNKIHKSGRVMSSILGQQISFARMDPFMKLEVVPVPTLSQDCIAALQQQSSAAAAVVAADTSEQKPISGKKRPLSHSLSGDMGYTLDFHMAGFESLTGNERKMVRLTKCPPSVNISDIENGPVKQFLTSREGATADSFEDLFDQDIGLTDADRNMYERDIFAQL